MGLFRPARRVTSASGDYWELYVSKTAVPAWKEGAAGADADPPASQQEALIELPFVLLAFLWSSIVVPLLRFAAVAPFSFARGRRSHAIRIEAVRTWPQRQVLLWTTTDDQVEGVLDSIAAGLAEDRFVQPLGAVYSGVRRD